MDDRLFEQTLSHTSQRGLNCCVSWLQPSAARFFPPPLGKPHRLSAAQPFHDWTERSNTKVYYVARSHSRPRFRWTSPPCTFKVANSIEGKGVREQGNWGMGERECGGVKKVSLHHPGLCHFKAELHQSLWFRSLRFNKPGQNSQTLLSRACSSGSASLPSSSLGSSWVTLTCTRSTRSAREFTREAKALAWVQISPKMSSAYLPRKSKETESLVHRNDRNTNQWPKSVSSTKHTCEISAMALAVCVYIVHN